MGVWHWESPEDTPSSAVWCPVRDERVGDSALEKSIARVGGAGIWAVALCTLGPRRPESGDLGTEA